MVPFTMRFYTRARAGTGCSLQFDDPVIVGAIAAIFSAPRRAIWIRLKPSLSRLCCNTTDSLATNVRC